MGLLVRLTNATTENSAEARLGGYSCVVYISDGGGGGVGSGTVYVQRYSNGEWKSYTELTFAAETAVKIDFEYGAVVRLVADGCDGVDVELVQ